MARVWAIAFWPTMALFAISLVSNLLMLTGPLFMLQVYDRVLASRSIPTLVALSGLVAGLYAFYALLEFIRLRMAGRFGSLLHERLAAPAFQAAMRLKLVSSSQSVDPVRDLDTLRQFVSSAGPVSLLDLPWLPIYLGLVFLLHPMMGWLAIAGAVIIVVLLVINEVFSQRPAQEIAAAALRRQVEGEDARSNAEVVAAMGMLGAITSRWGASASALVEAQQRASDRTAFYSSVTKAFRFVLQSAVLAVGAYLVIQGEITAGLMIAASIITSRALVPVEQVVGQWRGFVAARQSLKRLVGVLGATAAAPRQTNLPLPSKSILVAQLATGPDRQRRPLVAGITFSLHAGEAMGILGLSGSGKSTLARAVVGVWPVLQGEIRFDGSELSHFDAEIIGRAFGYLPQEVELFDGTVAENISRFQPGASTDDILAAAMATRTHELIAALPDGYDTRIGPGGAELSAGQRQRIGLARAIFGNPFMLVLDEPNSNLDSEGEAALTGVIQAAKQRGAIVIVIAHRPSAISAVDKLLFMQNGRQGTFGPRDAVLREITRPAVVAGTERSHG